MTGTNLPHAALITHSDLPGIGGRLGPELGDFCVDEIPLYQPSGAGEHLYVRVEKRDLTTPELVRIVARASGANVRDIGYAGLKDKHAVTTQWLSLLEKQAQPVERWDLPPTVRTLDVSRHVNKLRTGHLRGNRFRIRLVDVDPYSLSHARALAARLTNQGMLNYFGAQRFGHRGRNLSDALATFRGTRDGHRRLRSFKLKLLVSVLQSEVFNRYLTARHKRGLDHLLSGEVVRLSGSNSLFVVQDPKSEQARFESRDIIATGPIFGPKCRAPEGEALELETQAQKGIELSEQSLIQVGRHGRGTRRDLVVWPKHLRVSEPTPGCVEVCFELDSGAYATQLVRELTREEFLPP